jgi:hypothetical protein
MHKHWVAGAVIVTAAIFAGLRTPTRAQAPAATPGLLMTGAVATQMVAAWNDRPPPLG